VQPEAQALWYPATDMALTDHEDYVLLALTQGQDMVLIGPPLLDDESVFESVFTTHTVLSRDQAVCLLLAPGKALKIEP